MSQKRAEKLRTISFKTSDCGQKHGDYACNSRKVTAIISELWRQQRYENASYLYRCRQIRGEIDCKQRFYAYEEEKQNAILTVYGVDAQTPWGFIPAGCVSHRIKQGRCVPHVPITAAARLLL